MDRLTVTIEELIWICEVLQQHQDEHGPDFTCRTIIRKIERYVGDLRVALFPPPGNDQPLTPLQTESGTWIPFSPLRAVVSVSTLFVRGVRHPF